MEIVNSPINVQPNASDVYAESWKIMWKSFVLLLIVFILYAIISGPTTMFQMKAERFDWNLMPFGIFAMSFGLFIAGPIGYSTNWVFLKAVRSEPFEIRDMFAVFERNYWNAVGARVVVGLFVGVGLVMLIVPGIIIACRFAFVSYLIIDREMSLVEALNKSWEMTRGYGMQIFLMGIIAIVVGILGLLALFVGVFISAIWIQTAFATMYQAVVEKEGYFNSALRK